MLFACGLAFSFFLVEAQDSVCSGYHDPKRDQDVGGALIAKKPGSELDCCSLCNDEPGCQGWSWTMDQSSPTCYLKGDLTHLYENQGRTAGVKSYPVDCNGFGDEEPDKDLVGDLLLPDGEFALTSDECCFLCKRQEGCQGYSFFQQRCYLKGDVTQTYSSKGRVARRRISSLQETASAPKPPSCSGYSNLLTDRDLRGILVGVFPGEISDCCSLCDTILDCAGWSWFDGTCYLKGFLNGTYANQGRISGVKFVGPPQCPGFDKGRKDTDLTGILLARIAAPQSLNSCCEECARNDQCQGFSYFQNYCYLKGNVTGTYHNPGRIAQCNLTTADRCTPVDAPGPFVFV